VLVVLVFLPGLTLRLHHYTVTRHRAPCAVVQAFLLGLSINWEAFEWDSIL
jgi:hypothetical protein